MDIVLAALKWRIGWVDFQDELEVGTGCKCEVCNLIRACDEEALKYCRKCGYKLDDGWCARCHKPGRPSTSKNVKA